MFGRKNAFTPGEVARMRTALEWYADETNWRRIAVHQKGDPVKWVKSLAAIDRGERARRALQKSWSSRLFSALRVVAKHMVGETKTIVMPDEGATATFSLVPITEEAKPGTTLEFAAPESAKEE